MNSIYKSLLLLVLFNTYCGFSQEGAPSCAELQANFEQYQSCATNIPFQNSTNNTSGETYFLQSTCIQTNFQGPTWFFMEIQNSGDINLMISQVSNNGQGADVDFVIWGPFASLNNVCNQLTQANQIDCSYLDIAIEFPILPNAIAGEFYILLVDNFANVPGLITITQIGGDGSSDCSFLSSVEITDDASAEISIVNYCKPNTKSIFARVATSDFDGNVADLRFNYKWYKDGALIGTVINSLASTDMISVAETGLYKVEMTAYDSTDITVDLDNLPISTDEIQLNFYETPVLTTPITLIQCDYISPNTDGIAVVDLTQVNNQITNNDNAITLGYFLDSALTQPIANPEAYTNTTSPFNQTIYVTGIYASNPLLCASNIATIELQINPTSLANYPDITAVCPELNTNFGLIDFDTQKSVIKNAFFPITDVIIAFYQTANDAAIEQNELTNTTPILIGTNTIFARIETNNSCEGIGTFEVIVHPAPSQNTIAPILVCESENIILANKDNEILSGLNASVQASYYNSFENARDNLNQINKNTNYDAGIGNTIVYVRLFDSAVQCFSIANFNVTVFANPNISQPSPMSVCGATTAVFNLQNRNQQITNNNTNYQVTFYETSNDLANDIPIGDSSAYLSASKRIYVKVVDTVNNNCSATTTLDLKVNENPGSANNPQLLEGCEDSGFYVFDLTERALPMIGSTPSSEIILEYYTDLTEAVNHSENFIAAPDSFTNTIIGYQKIYVRITSTINFDSDTNLPCYRILEQELFVRSYPENLIKSTPYRICIDINNQVVNPAFIENKLPESDYYSVWFKEFDAVQDNQILGANGNTFTTDVEGNYSVRISDLSNSALCTIVTNFSTKKTLIPFSLEGDPTDLVAFEVDNTITAVVTPLSTDFEYQLNNNGWQDSNIFYDVKEGFYELVVRNKQGCGELSTTVVMVDYPRFFTPNGDGFNDLWNIGGRLGLDMSNVYIYNKMGKLVKELVKDETGWDGTLNGNPLPADDYWFRINFTKGGLQSEFRSHFALKR